MRNPIDKTISGVLAQAVSVQRGADSHGESLGLKHMTSGVLLALYKSAQRALEVYEAGRKTLWERRRVVEARTKEGRAFMTLSRDLQKPLFGNTFNPKWGETGLKGSLEVPYQPGELGVSLALWALFLKNHPELELAERNITADRAEELSEALVNAMGDVDAQKAVVMQLLRDKDAKFAALRKGLRDLINELKTLLSPTDPTWKAFGLNPPGAVQAPEVPENVIVDIMNHEGAVVRWDPAPRAEYYRSFARVEGVDTEFQSVGNSSDPHFILQPLPANAIVELAISAVNAGGESARSGVLRIRSDQAGKEAAQSAENAAEIAAL
jgi:hypothetical protein